MNEDEVLYHQYNTFINLRVLDKALAIQYIIQLEKELRYAKI